jgi:hypothetical protein
MLRRFWYIAWTMRARSAASNASHLGVDVLQGDGLPGNLGHDLIGVRGRRLRLRGGGRLLGACACQCGGRRQQ